MNRAFSPGDSGTDAVARMSTTAKPVTRRAGGSCPGAGSGSASIIRRMTMAKKKAAKKKKVAKKKKK
jgi:hypothetical protein